MRAVVPVAAALALSLTGTAPAPLFVFERAPHDAVRAAGTRSEAPQIYFTPAGEVVLLAAVGDGTKTALAQLVSSDGGDSFVRARDVVAPGAGLETRGEMRPQFVPDAGGEGAFGVWQDMPGPGHHGAAAPGPLLRVARVTLEEHLPIVPAVLDGNVRAYDGAATVAVRGDGTPLAAWAGHEGEESGAIYVASSQDGQTFGLPVRLAGTACECCRPSLVLRGDTAYLAWRGVFANDRRDVVVAVSHDRGASWGAPVRVSRDGWSIRGCPNSGPVLALDGATLHVVWFTLGNSGRAQLRASSSKDGMHFAPARTISAPVLDANHPRFVEGPVPFPMVVFEGRDPGGAGFGRLHPFLAAYRNGAWTAPQAVPGDAARDVGDVVATMRDPATIYIAQTARDARGATVELLRGRLR